MDDLYIQSNSEARGHRQIFLKTIKSLSVVPDNYLTEWSRCDDYYAEPNIKYPHDGETWICDCTRLTSIHKRCICKQHIGDSMTLKNKLSGIIIWIGMDCAKQYLKINTRENTCLECGQYTRKNKTNLCKKCKKLYIFSFGEHNGKTFHEVMKSDVKYCNWVYNEPNLTGKLLQFKRWLVIKIQLTAGNDY